VLRNLLYIFVLLIVIGSCSKSDSNETNSQNKFKLLVNKKWQFLTVSAVLADGTTQSDYFANQPDYKKDNYYYYKSDLTFTINDNIKKNNPGDPDIIDSGTWVLHSDESIYVKSTSGIRYDPVKIAIIDESDMQLVSKNSSGITLDISYVVIP
jgi:hypothetical protein